jgi:secondary thiamine-phosphate synthase enzyme
MKCLQVLTACEDVKKTMTKSSAANVPEAPAPGAGSLTTGAFAVHADMLLVQTEERVELIDITDRVMALVAASRIREGLVSLWSMHTTFAVFMNESQPALHADIKRLLEQIVDRDADWMHNDPDHSDCDRFNADAHLRAMLLGHGLSLQVSGGVVVLGQWQRVLAAELDGPRARTLRVQVMGVQ